MKTLYAIAARTEKSFNAGYWQPEKLIVDTEAYYFDTKVEAEAERLNALNVFKKRGYTMTLEVVKHILLD